MRKKINVNSYSFRERGYKDSGVFYLVRARNLKTARGIANKRWKKKIVLSSGRIL